MIRTFKFNVQQNVRIKPLENLVGVVVSIWVCLAHYEYKVRYFNNGDSKEAYFFEEELAGEE